MYLKSLELTNFRKFGIENNLVEFVDSKENLMTPEDINVAKTISLIVGKNNSEGTYKPNCVNHPTTSLLCIFFHNFAEKYTK